MLMQSRIVPMFPELLVRTKLGYSEFLAKDSIALDYRTCKILCDKDGVAVIYSQREDRDFAEWWPISYLIGLVQPYLSEE